MKMVFSLFYLEKKQLATVSDVIITQQFAQYKLFQMKVINELADHEQASNYASAQRGKEEAEERAAKELMEELRKLQEMQEVNSTKSM